jgi:hypothetical protein
MGLGWLLLQSGRFVLIVGSAFIRLNSGVHCAAAPPPLVGALEQHYIGRQCFIDANDNSTLVVEFKHSFADNCGRSLNLFVSFDNFDSAVTCHQNNM